jgi:hypothetical protein
LKIEKPRIRKKVKPEKIGSSKTFPKPGTETTIASRLAHLAIAGTRNSHSGYYGRQIGIAKAPLVCPRGAWD